MGCWNATCGITNLPILYNEEVYTHILVSSVTKRSSANTRHYHNDVCIPLSFPIIGKYDDYGSISNIQYNITTELMSRYFGCEFDELLSRIQDDSIKIADDVNIKDIKTVGIWMCRKDVVDNFFKTDFEIPVYSDKYRVHDIPLNIAFNDSAREYYERLCSIKNSDSSYTRYMDKPLRETEAPLDVAICGSYASYRIIGPFFEQQLKWLKFLIKNNYDFDSDEVRSFFECAKNYLKIDLILENTRRGYQPQFGAGSQSFNIDSYKRLQSVTSKSLSNMINRYQD